MALETATYIDGLVATNPAGGDAIAQADDHLRLIKSTLKATFPNITGAVTPTHTDLNTRLMPSGGIIMWSGAQAAIPSGWVLCDGNNSTPDLRGRFVIGAGGAYSVGAAGGNASVTLSEAQLPSHTHGASSTFTGTALGTHSHSISDPGHSHYTANTGTRNVSTGNTTDGYVGFVGAGGTDFDLRSSDQSTAPNRGMSGTSSTGISVGSSSAGTPSGTVATSISATGSGSSIDIRNPYYALCYIMKV